ncbi:MAG: hypothetical protein BWY70_00372 [Bacteroidetes bacterium ADurb.Bin408]|nr:MAG: hypothetical protein BWY70_00372 [Bacteroidetes bacterium ADurb.Bin408]
MDSPQPTPTQKSWSFLQTFTADQMPINLLNLRKLSNRELIIEYSGVSVESGTATTTILKTYEKK